MLNPKHICLVCHENAVIATGWHKPTNWYCRNHFLDKLWTYLIATDGEDGFIPWSVPQAPDD